MNILHAVSIMLEVITLVFGVLLATVRKKSYGWLIALTFFIYVFYDMANFTPLNISKDILYALFFVASASILLAVISAFTDKNN